MSIKTLGIDIAQRVFSLHGIDEAGSRTLKKTIKREQLPLFIRNLSPCLIVMEACGGSQYWAREFIKMGHEVKLIHPQFVKPFRKSFKNDANDAEAIVEAASRPSMRYVAIKPLWKLEIQQMHRIRQRLVECRTGLMNQIRGILHEYGMIFDKKAGKLMPEIRDIAINGAPDVSRGMQMILSKLVDEYDRLEDEIKYIEGDLMMIAKSDEQCVRLQEITGIGYLSSTAILGSVVDPNLFKSARHFAAWVGLVPRQNSTGGRTVLLGINKHGDKYLRFMLIHGARAALKNSKNKPDKVSKWAYKKWQELGFNRACVALANKNARIIWAMMSSEEHYCAQALVS